MTTLTGTHLCDLTRIGIGLVTVGAETLGTSALDVVLLGLLVGLACLLYKPFLTVTLLFARSVPQLALRTGRTVANSGTGSIARTGSRTGTLSDDEVRLGSMVTLTMATLGWLGNRIVRSSLISLGGTRTSP